MSSDRVLIDSLRDAVIVHRNGVILHVNPAALSGFGYASADELLGRSVLEVVHPDDHAIVRERIRAMSTDGQPAPIMEERFLRKDGTVVFCEVAAMPTTFDGAPAIIALGRDVTERKQLEAKLILADRLASIGRLAASVGHEINNPLAYVLGNINLMKHDLDSETSPATRALRERLLERLAVIEEGALRMRDIVADLKRLSHGSNEIVGPIDLHRVLDICINMAEREIVARARLRKAYGAPALVSVNEARLGQVFLNLLVNAAQCIPEGARPEDNEVRVSTRTIEGDRVEVEIADTGAGLSDEVREHLFEPFVTTKPAGAGTGLGLSISHHIVTSLGGSIVALPREGRGTSFVVTLPTEPDEGDDRKVGSAPPFSSRR